MDVDSGIFMLRRISRSKTSHPKKHPFALTLASSNVNNETDYQSRRTATPAKPAVSLWKLRLFIYERIYQRDDSKWIDRTNSQVESKRMALIPTWRNIHALRLIQTKRIDPRNCRVELTIIQTRRSGKRMADSHCTYLEGFTSEVDPNSLSEKGLLQILPLLIGADPWPDTLSHLGSHYVRECAAEIPLSTIKAHLRMYSRWNQTT